MALNIKDSSVHDAVKRITSITGESQAQAVAVAVRERLARLEKDELAARLLAIGRKTASRMSAETELDHGAPALRRSGAPGVIVDTSAVIAILTAEDDATIYAHAIADASVRRLSAASYLECGIVLTPNEIRSSAEVLTS